MTTADPALDTAGGDARRHADSRQPAGRRLDAIERGWRPMAISVGASAALAVLTAVRFVFLVRLLPPAEYGRMNIFLTLTSVAPLMMALAMPWQYQRVARREGAAAVGSLCRSALIINVVSTAPALVALFAIAAPVAGRAHPGTVAVLLVAISFATSMTTMYASIMLGLGRRSLSSIVMFAINIGPTLSLVPIALTDEATVVALLGWTALVCVIITIATRMVLARVVRPWPSRRRRGLLSFREGALSLPAVVGPWAFILCTRYLLGLNVDVTAVAIFAICSTVADMSFLVSAAALNYFSNRVLDEQQAPTRGLMLVVPMHVALTAAGSLLIAVVLPRLGNDQYHVSWPAIAVLCLAGAARLHFSAWRVRAVGRQRAHMSAWTYLVVVLAGTAFLAIVRPQALVVYAFVLFAGFACAAAAQRISLRGASAPTRPAQSAVLPGLPG